MSEWKLDGNVNDTKSGYNATLFGNPPYVAAKIGQGLDFTGNGTDGLGGQYAEMPSNPTLDDLAEGAEYSISAWFNPASAPSGAGSSQFWMVVGKTNTQAIGIVFNMNQRFAARHYTNEGGNVLQLATSTSTFPLDQWHHVVAVVTKGSSTVPGSLELYVNGQLSNTDTWTGGTPAKNFGTARWRIGKSDTDWSANGRVDQVRFYNVALTQANVTELFQETAPVPTFRFPVGMAKDHDPDLGTDAFSYNPDGKRSAIGKSMLPTLRYARQHGARVIMTVTGADNQNLRTNPAAKSPFAKGTWLSRFNSAAAAISPDTVRDYVKDGTLIGIYVIDEPWSDFTEFTYRTLDSLCQHVKAEWPWAPCIARTDNAIIDTNTPATYTYQHLDAGWAQITDFKERNSTHGTTRSYYEDELAAGKKHGLGLWYGFNLIHYVNKNYDPNCSPQLDSEGKCAMSAAELRAVADAIEAIDAQGGVDGVKGCGVSGWYLEKDAGAKRNYFLSTGITSALQYLWNRTAGRNLQPGPCNIRGDLPAP